MNRPRVELYEVLNDDKVIGYEWITTGKNGTPWYTNLSADAEEGLPINGRFKGRFEHYDRQGQPIISRYARRLVWASADDDNSLQSPAD